jgi:hypothetical protein
MFMPFKFRILFSGICAFVPGQDGSFDQPEHRSGFFKSVTVVLPNMRRAKAVEGGNARDSHLARLELDRRQNWTGDRDPDLIAPKIGKDVYTLDRERVSFRFTGAATPQGIEILNFDSVPPPNPTQPVPGTPEERFFWWVPKMGRVVPQSERIRGRFLQDADEIIGWVELTQGLFATEPPVSPNVMDFRPINGSSVALRQKIARRIAVEVSEVETVEIVFHQEGGGDRTRSLTEAQGTVDIEVMNRELDHLLGDPIGAPVPANGQPDVDFTTYFEMASGRQPAAVVPHEPIPQSGVGVAPISLRIGGVCPPAAFSGATPGAGE